MINIEKEEKYRIFRFITKGSVYGQGDTPNEALQSFIKSLNEEKEIHSNALFELTELEKEIEEYKKSDKYCGLPFVDVKN